MEKGARITFAVFLLFVFMHYGETCRSSITAIRMQSDITRRPFKDNKYYLDSLGWPGWRANLCRDHTVRTTQIGGPQPPAWYKGPDPSSGATRRSHEIRYRFEVANHDRKEGTMFVHIDVFRCRAAGFHTGVFSNGIRACFSDCEEHNVDGASCQYSCYAGYHLVGPSTVTCQGTIWSATSPPVCQRRNCGAPPTIPNAVLNCPNGHTYDSRCYVTCRSGYYLTGSRYTTCLSDGRWSHVGVPCKDVESPTFPNGCVPDIERLPVGQQTTVSWTAPYAVDSSRTTPTITYRLPGTSQHTSSTSATFQMGTHQIAAFASDPSGNTATCTFTVKIPVVTCANPKRELNVTHMVYRPDPYGPQPLGTVINLTCDLGYPQHGAKQIRCELVPNMGNKMTRWTWVGDTVDMKPNCVVQPCPQLTPPLNGALSCFTSTVGTDCLMFCNDRYDIPPNVKQRSGDRFTCVRSNPTVWFPTKVADCTEVVMPGHVYVQQEIFYYAGSCNDSIGYLQQGFVDRMKNNSLLMDACTTACVPQNVQVFCGNTNVYRGRRSTKQVYIKLTFDVLIEYSNATTLQELSAVKNKLQTILREEISGNGSLVFDGFTTDEHSIGPNRVGCQCSSGKICNENLLCVGCSKGYYMPVGDTECRECPLNSYQETDGATSCVLCPAGTFTESTASHNSSQCLEPQAGGWGDWGMWTECSLSCGGGEQQRQRACDNPTPAPGGRDCQGSDNETRACGLPNCPVDGVWGQWSSWSQCSATCGGGETTRRRQCNNPAAQHGGTACSGPDTEIVLCNNVTCPVDGGWGQWTDWGLCSASCEGGSQTRDRLCDSPAPSEGGNNCTGEATQIRHCNNETCLECPSFEEPANTKDPNVILNGNEMNVTIECLPGFIWAMNFAPSFYCGPNTNFTWSQVPYLPVPFEPPFCSKMEATTGGSGQFSIPFNHSCVANESILTDLALQVESRLATLPCKHLQTTTSQCTTAALITCERPKPVEEVLGNGTAAVTRRKRSTEDDESKMLTLIIGLSGEISNTTDFTPGTPAYNQYLEVMQGVEESIRMILEDADQLFYLKINGQDVHPEVENIFAVGSYRCPPGCALRSSFCLKCPSGTYEKESQCVYCPLGQYQDETGQTSCKPCPPGTASDTVGAYHLNQCTHPFVAPANPDSPELGGSEPSLSMGVIAGLSVAAVVVAVAVTAAVLYKLKRRKVLKLNSSLSSLNHHDQTYNLRG